MGAQTIPGVGELFTYMKTDGAVHYNNRKRECKLSCSCGGSCDGVTTSHTEEIVKVIRWMDNSVELIMKSGHAITVVAPHGDACF